MANTRKRRGRETEMAGAKYYRSGGWPFVVTVAASLPGRDLVGMPGLAPEIKARREFNAVAWLRQARKNAGDDLPFVLWRPDGYGVERVKEWAVLMYAEDHRKLLLEAGYGGTQFNPDETREDEGRLTREPRTYEDEEAA